MILVKKVHFMMKKLQGANKKIKKRDGVGFMKNVVDTTF